MRISSILATHRGSDIVTLHLRTTRMVGFPRLCSAPVAEIARATVGHMIHVVVNAHQSCLPACPVPLYLQTLLDTCSRSGARRLIGPLRITEPALPPCQGKSATPSRPDPSEAHRHTGIGRGSYPLHSSRVKLAAERYDPDDGLVTNSPPLVAHVVTLKPSPSPDYDSSSDSPEPEQLPPGTKARRRPRAQASRGDAVLIGFMGGLNHPELANRAGEEVLPQSDSEPSSVANDVESPPGAAEQADDSVNLAGSPLSLSDVEPIERQVFTGSSETGNGGRPELPRLQTEEQGASSIHEVTISHDAPQPQSPDESESLSPRQISPRTATDSTPGVAVTNARSTKSPVSSRSSTDREPGHRAMSSALRPYTVTSADRTPGDTLPAMQTSPPTNTSKSPGPPQGLPSLHDSGLKPLLDGGPVKNGFPAHSTPSASSSALSPAASSKMARFPSSPGRSNSAFPQNFAHGQPSPAYSNASPREAARMSAPSHPNIQPPKFPPKSASEALTPQSADNCTIGYAGASSPLPSGEPIEIDRAGRILPPLVPHLGPPIINGHFKCQHEGCTAAPFQTQYLLKYAFLHRHLLPCRQQLTDDSSHANVHSQSRPHYCPVPSCPRSESGRGFKRKNEMIRHGLVHDSPGYVCPFCPEREHKYPRPDNLQRLVSLRSRRIRPWLIWNRHVRGNHLDKDMNDPELREVLSQRLQGGSRGRRRRLGSR